MARRTFEAMETRVWSDLVRNDAGTKQARKAIDADIVLDLDTSVTLDQYRGPASRELVEALAGGVNNEAWKLAFMSHLEAAQIAQELGVYENLRAVVDLIRWCRRSVGLAEEFPTGRWGIFEKIKYPGESDSNSVLAIVAPKTPSDDGVSKLGFIPSCDGISLKIT